MANKLNQGQQDAADGFFDFLLSDEKEMIISGPGGVGKTFLMGQMIDDVIPRYQSTCKALGMKADYVDVYMTATTNKAADVLSIASNRPTGTIHQHLNLKVLEDYGTGKSTLSKTREWKVHQNQVLFIDECSMIDTPLRRLVREGTHASKIVYVGDHCQLAPVMEKLSPIYRDGLRTYELTQPMRTDNPELQALNMQLRATVETGIFKPIQIIPGVIDWLNQDQMVDEIQEHFVNKGTTDRILAYTNKQVISLNRYIRDLRGLPTELSVGENLINNSMVKVKSGSLSVEEAVEIIELSEEVESYYPHPEAEVFIRRATIRTPLKGLFTNVMIPVDRVHAQSVMKWLAQRKYWSDYFNMKQSVPDLRERDAATTHKAQGSTHGTVYIDATDISTCRDPDQTARLLYVAASRARSRVVFYGELADKFGGFAH